MDHNSKTSPGAFAPFFRGPLHPLFLLTAPAITATILYYHPHTILGFRPTSILPSSGRTKGLNYSEAKERVMPCWTTSGGILLTTFPSRDGTGPTFLYLRSHRAMTVGETTSSAAPVRFLSWTCCRNTLAANYPKNARVTYATFNRHSCKLQPLMSCLISLSICTIFD